jgi:hypothetical protein
MNQTDIDKAFEGRWRIKNHVFSAEDHVQGEIKALCRDFFEAGILLAGEEELPVWRKPPTIVEADIPPECLVRESDILTVEDTFNKWWELYDKKRGRDKCITKWKKMTATEQFACIAATPAYVESTPDKAYRKDPLTYLNGKCWNDEIIIKNNGTNKPTTDQQRLERLADILAE